MGSFMIMCLHKWANMHIGDFKDMIALVASPSHLSLGGWEREWESEWENEKGCDIANKHASQEINS